MTILALEWARENGPPRSLKGELLDWLLAFLLATTLVTAALHLFTFSGSFGFRWYTSALILVPTLGVVMMSPGIVATLINIKPRWKRESLVFLVIAAVVGFPLAIAAYTDGGVGGVLFEWSWLATLLASVSTVGLWILKDDPAVPGYEDVEPEPFTLDRVFVLVGVVVPLSTLAAILAPSLEPRLVFALWWGVPGISALLFPPQNAPNWRRFGIVSLALAALASAAVAVLS